MTERARVAAAPACSTLHQPVSPSAVPRRKSPIPERRRRAGGRVTYISQPPGRPRPSARRAGRRGRYWPRRANPCGRTHRIQRHQSRLGRRVSFPRPATAILCGLGAGGRRRGLSLLLAARAAAALGYDYGDFPAHDGLWMMAEQTAHDVLVRMALVPRVLAARGLDVTPGMMERLSAAGDDETAALLAIIQRDEIGHVAIGTHWFHHVCSERGLAPQQTFQRLIGEYLKGRIKGPFHHAARLQAGFSEDELALLDDLDQLPNDISDETSKHSNACAATHKEKQRARDK